MAAQYPGVPPQQDPSQAWLPPATLPYMPYGPPQPPSAAPMYELRPLNLSEILDRTFSLYRSRFWLFAGISAFSGAVQACTVAAQMLTQRRLMRLGQASAGAANAPLVPHMTDFLGPLLVVVGTLVFFLAYSITTGATVFAVGETYLGRITSVMDAFRATLGRWYRYIAIAIWQAFSFVWMPIVLIGPGFAIIAARASSLLWLGVTLMLLGVFGGVVGGYIFYLRNMLAVPACVTERMTIRASMRRSKVLGAGTKVRIFVLHLITVALYMVVGVLEAPFSLIAMVSLTKTHGVMPYVLQAITVIIAFVGHTVVAPVLAIGLTLVYFDQRVRKEAFDIALLLGEETALEAGALAVDAGPETVVATEMRSAEGHAGDAPLL